MFGCNLLSSITDLDFVGQLEGEDESLFSVNNAAIDVVEGPPGPIWQKSRLFIYKPGDTLDWDLEIYGTNVLPTQPLNSNSEIVFVLDVNKLDPTKILAILELPVGAARYWDMLSKSTGSVYHVFRENYDPRTQGESEQALSVHIQTYQIPPPVPPIG